MRNRFVLAAMTSLLIVGSANAAPKETLYFEFEMDGDVDKTGAGPEGVRGNNSPVWFRFVGGGMLDKTGIVWSNNSYSETDAANCFNNGVIDNVDLQLVRTQSGAAQASMWFLGRTSEPGGAEIKYLLTLVDPNGWIGLTDDRFPPRSGSVVMVATEWALETEGKGKLKNVSCKGSGNADGESALTRIELRVVSSP